MNEPERFIRSRGATGQLLASAKADAPPAGSRRRAIVAATAAVAASSKAASAAGAFGALGRLAVWKWVAVGAIVAGTVVAARTVIPRPRSAEPTAALAPPMRPRAPLASPARNEVRTIPPSEPPAPGIAVSPQTVTQAAPQAATQVGPQVTLQITPQITPQISPQLAAPTAVSSPPSKGQGFTGVPEATPTSAAPVSRSPPKVSRGPVDADDTRSSPTPRPAPAVATSRLSVEIAVIDDAKRALAGGDAAEALRQLDAYRVAFPSGTLAAEATALRIEAMARAGRRQEARALLDELRRSHPDSPLLDSLGQIVGE